MPTRNELTLTDKGHISIRLLPAHNILQPENGLLDTILGHSASLCKLICQHAVLQVIYSVLWLHAWNVAFKLPVTSCSTSTVHNSFVCTQSSLLAHASSNNFAGYMEYKAHQGTLLRTRNSKLSYGS